MDSGRPPRHPVSPHVDSTRLGAENYDIPIFRGCVTLDGVQAASSQHEGLDEWDTRQENNDTGAEIPLEDTEHGRDLEPMQIENPENMVRFICITVVLTNCSNI